MQVNDGWTNMFMVNIYTAAADGEDQQATSDHWKIMLMPEYVAFCVSIMLYMFGMAVVYQCAPSLAEECGMYIGTDILNAPTSGSSTYSNQ